jgi:hypothetical protein
MHGSPHRNGCPIQYTPIRRGVAEPPIEAAMFPLLVEINLTQSFILLSGRE